MEPALLSLLHDHAVPETVMVFLREQGCDCMSLFASWCDSLQTVQRDILDHVPEERTNRRAAAALRHCILLARAIVQVEIQEQRKVGITTPSESASEDPGRASAPAPLAATVAQIMAFCSKVTPAEISRAADYVRKWAAIFKYGPRHGPYRGQTLPQVPGMPGWHNLQDLLAFSEDDQKGITPMAAVAAMNADDPREQSRRPRWRFDFSGTSVYVIYDRR